MDCRDVERLDQLLQFKRQMLDAEIRMQAMIADNKNLEGIVAHDGKDFLDLLNDVGHNCYPYGGGY